MKKRTILSLIITIVILFFTNKFWLEFKPLFVEFDIKGNGNTHIVFQLNKKNNNKFKKVKDANANFNLDKTKVAKFYIKNAKYPKRFRIIIDNFDNQTPISITNIRLKNGKYKFNEMNKFFVEGAKSEIKNNELIIYPRNKKIYITYSDKIKIRTSIRFNFEIFVIILVLSFLLIYKISDYVADFSTIKHKSRIDIIFLLIFFTFLFIPMSHINQDKISKQENRTLAVWQPFIKKNGEINFNFGKDYEKWFNDRFNLREFFVNTNNFILFSFNHKNDKGIMDKKTGHLYNNMEFNLASKNRIKNNIKELYKFNDFCRKNNIKLYTLIVPSKGVIYPSEYNYYLSKSNHIDFISFVAKSNEENKIKIIYPYNEMKQASVDNFMFFKTEHHWTDDGAFIGYKALMKEIKNDFPDINIVNENDFNYFYNKKIRGDWGRTFGTGQTCWRLGLSSNICDDWHKTDYRYYKHKDFNNLKQEMQNIDYHRNKTYFYDKGSNYRVVLLGTSQSENLTEFIPFTFKNVKRIRNNNVKKIEPKNEFKIMKYHKEEILEYKPNILIFCITYGNFFALNNLLKE